MSIELEIFRKKVYLDTVLSTLIQRTPNLLPQWITDNQINFVSAYQFCYYDVEDQHTHIIPRKQGQQQIISIQFKAEVNQNNSTIHYIYRKQENFYLVEQLGYKHQEILLYQNNIDNRQFLVYQFLDYLMNQGEQLKSSKSIASRTQRLIQEIKQEEDKQTLKDSVHQLKDIKQLTIIYQCGFALLLVEMKKKTGLMLVNINKSAKFNKKDDFFCPIRPANYNIASHQLSSQQLSSPRIIYLFPDSVISLHKTKDITQFVLLTSRDILFIKIDYEQMQFHILDKKTCHKKQRFLSLSISAQRQQTIILALCESSKPYETSIRQIKKKKLIKMFSIEQNQLKEIKQKRNQLNGLKYEFQIEKDLQFDEQISSVVRSNVRFNDNVQHSQYQIQEDKNQIGDIEDFNRGILMSVYNTIMGPQKNEQVEQSHKNLNELSIVQPFIKRQDKIIKDIAGFACNQKLVIIWERNEPVIHICQIISSREQDQLQKSDKIEKKTMQLLKQQKQKQIKQVYSQLLGIPISDCRESGQHLHPKLIYVCKVQLQLIQLKISQIIISPNNSNLFIISGNDSHEHTEIVNFHIFQIDLFRQLGNQNSNIFIKTIKNIYKPKPTELIVTSLVKELAFFLTGNSLHSLQSELLDGVLSFDVHPYNVFFAVSFGFTTKIYAFQGSDKLTSLFTMNGQGMKQVKYSPLGNHLCILFSKSIKVLDSYNFMTKFTINEKSSNFLKCYFSSNGLQLYTSNQNHHFAIYNTFDYTKVESIKPNIAINEWKPISIKAYLKISQYCLVLQCGSLYVKYKSNAIVVTPQQVYSYNDGQKIKCIEIDEKNGILFTGCQSGLIRAHLWPNKDGFFECYSELRTSFCEVSCLSLSHISSTLYLGNVNGNISKLKYIIDRDKGTSHEQSENNLLSQKNFKHFSITGLNNIQRMYQYVLANNASTSQELPEKVKLQYKLSQVIQKLNDEMRKMKLDIRKELDQRTKQNMEKVDFGLLYHLHQMIATKLYAQLREEIQFNQKQIRQMKQNNIEQFNKIIAQQVELIKQKSFNISDFIELRQRIKKEHSIQEEKLKEQNEKQIKLIEGKTKQSQKIKECAQEEIYFISNNFVQQYLSEKRRIEKEIQYQNKRHFELRKQCAYKQTAIKGLNEKTIKEESLQFKLQLQYSEMEKKLAYNNQIIDQFRNKILQAELKAHKVQIQSSIIKSYAQYQRVANVEQMIDACSYNIWLKNKIQKQIADLSDYLRNMEQFLDKKGDEIVDLISISAKNQNQINHLSTISKNQKQKLKNKRCILLNIHNKLKKVDPINEYKSLRNSSEEKSPQRYAMRLTSRDKNHKNIKSVQRKKRVQKSQRYTRINSKNFQCIDTIIDKETKFLKSSMKIHHKKINRLEKENGEMLFEYQKLKFEQKNLKEKQFSHFNQLQKVQNQIECAQIRQFRKTNTKIQLSKTSFQKYLQLKSSKTTSRTKYKTATSSPLHSSNTTFLVVQSQKQ